MNETDLNNINPDDLKDFNELLSAYRKYLMDELGYDEEDAVLATSDFDDPYNMEYIVQDYEGEYSVDGVEYEVRSCHTDFMQIGLFHLAGVTPFEFYMFMNLEDIDGTVGSYMNSRKKYVL